MEKILVSDIMTRDPIIIKPTTNLLECAKKMVKKKVGSLLIVDNKRLVGFVSRKDILWALVKKSRKDLLDITAVDISPRKIAAIKPTSSIREALDKMKKLKFQTLPVIYNGSLVGMVTIKDILNFYPEAYEELGEFDKIREESQKLKRISKAKNRREGICEECGNFDILYKVNDTLMCESCMEKI